jgi:hypothetical protein
MNKAKMKKLFLEPSPILIIFENLKENTEYSLYVKKEHKNDRKKLRTLENSFKICDGNRVPPPINGVLRLTWI